VCLQDLYRNAEKYLKEKSYVSKSQIVHAITMGRIEQNVRRVRTMIHVMAPRNHDDVELPKVDIVISQVFNCSDFIGVCLCCVLRYTGCGYWL
jgi:exosome complex RNA-binding protein Csl4